jgi:hypothetical protein
MTPTTLALSPEKLDLLKRWFNNHDKLKARSADVMAVLPTLKEVAKTRHVLAHSLIAGYDAETGDITLKSITPLADDNFRHKTETLNIKGAFAVSELANTANRFLASLAIEVFVPDALTRFQMPE